MQESAPVTGIWVLAAVPVLRDVLVVTRRDAPPLEALFTLQPVRTPVNTVTLGAQRCTVGIPEWAAAHWNNKTSLFELRKQVFHSQEQLAHDLPKQSSSPHHIFEKQAALSSEISCRSHIIPVHSELRHFRIRTDTYKLQRHLAFPPFYDLCDYPFGFPPQP